MTAVPKPPRREKRPRAHNSTLPRASGGIPRSAPPKSVNRKRKASEFIRAYGSKERVAWVKGRGCVVRPSEKWPIVVHTPDIIDVAHIEAGGAGRKADASKTVGMCRLHHLTLHNKGRRWFEENFDLDLDELAAATEQAWQKHLEGA